MADDTAIAAAIDWLVKFESGDISLEERQAFDRWLAHSPQNALTWERLDQVSQHFGQCPNLNAEQALHSVKEAERCLKQKRRSLKTLVSVGGLGFALWLSRDYTGLSHGGGQLGRYAFGRAMADVMTAIGEQRHLSLQDGAQLSLNTQSAVDIDFQARPELTLHYGEIVMEASSGAWLRADNSVFKPSLGSAFSLFLKDEQCRLQVVRGHVECLLTTDHSVSTVHENEGLIIDSYRHSVSHFAPDAHNLAWRKGLITAEQMPLGRFINELSRYRLGYLGCADEIASLTLSGSFLIADTDAILDNLSQILPVRQRRISDYWVQLIPA